MWKWWVMSRSTGLFLVLFLAPRCRPEIGCFLRFFWIPLSEHDPIIMQKTEQRAHEQWLVVLRPHQLHCYPLPPSQQGRKLLHWCGSILTVQLIILEFFFPKGQEKTNQRNSTAPPRNPTRQSTAYGTARNPNKPGASVSSHWQHSRGH